MDSFEWNKIFGAVLAAALFVLVIRVGAEAIYHVEPLEKQAYVVQGVEHAATTEAAAPVEEPLPDFAAVIPTADLAAGAKLGERCLQCHDWTKGGPDKIGPNLYGLVGRPKATHGTFAYSAALKAKGGDWSYADLFHFLKMPAAFVPGTKMAFAGLPKPDDRVAIIAFLRTHADSPAALPPPAPAAAPSAEAAPAAAEGAAPAAPAAASAPAH